MSNENHEEIKIRERLEQAKRGSFIECPRLRLERVPKKVIDNPRERQPLNQTVFLSFIEV